MLQAISGDASLLSLLAAGGFGGQVHSVFKRVINIRGDDGELYSLTAASLDQGPLSLRLRSQDPSWEDWGVGVHDAVGTQGGVLIVGSLSVDFTQAQCWQGELPEFPHRECKDFSINMKVLARCICAAEKVGGLRMLLSAGKSNDVLANQLQQRATVLVAALAARAWPAADAAALRLIGLGRGLTPSGDDFCSGLVTILNLPRGPFAEEYRLFGRRLAAAAAGRTTDLSLMMLKQAAEGRARESVLKLLRAMAGGEPEAVRIAAARILNIGSLSGTDLAVGLYAGLDMGRRL